MHIRPYRGTDITDLIAVWNAANPADRIDTSRFIGKILLDPNFRVECAPVAEIDGRVVGFAFGITRQVALFNDGLQPNRAWITAFGVHPTVQRRGIGRALMTYLLDLFTTEGRTVIEIAPYVPNYIVPGVDVKAYSGGIAFLHTLGFETHYEAISMGVDLTGFVLPADLAQRDDDLTVSAVNGADLPDLLPFIQTHFGWDWARHATETLHAVLDGYPARTCFLVARLDGEIVGFCQQRHERFGPFGVREDCRGRGIGRVLLFNCLADMAAQGVYYAYFLWTHEKAACLYAQAGFRERRRFAILRRALP